MIRSLTLGLTVLAGAALIEAALVPAVLIGGAVVFAPKVLRRRQARPKARRTVAAAPTDVRLPAAAPPKFEFKQAIVKTVTFRIIVTSLDFTANYVVVGELAAAAGLSAFGLVAGPLFYLAHEMFWNRIDGSQDTIDVRDLVRLPSETEQPRSERPLRINRALAKTITFRSIATTMDFAVNYWVVRDVATAAGLSAFGAVVGPFVYYGHEKIWERLGRPAAQDATAAQSGPRLLPA